MPLLMLAFGVWCSLYTVNAFFPVRHNRLLFAISFFNSWIAIEGSWFWLLFEGAIGGLLVWGGALEHGVGWLGLVVLGLSWIGQLVLLVQGRGAGVAATTALGDFGRDLLAQRSEAPRQKVEVDKNVEFRKVAGKRLRLDVYRPATGPVPGERHPAILQIHGGAWVLGDKREQGIPLLKYLASHGWVGFNVNYRLSPGATWPDHLVDVKAALAWIRDHADEYGIDPGFVVVTGGSAGGHLTAMMALTANDPRYQPGFEDADTSVQAAVPFYGVYDFTNRDGHMPPEFINWILQPLVVKAFIADEPERFRAASPLDQVRPDAPPFLIVHGDRDTLAPVQDARLFARLLRETSTSAVIYLELRGAQHAFDVFGSPRTRRTVEAVERFLYTVHDAYLHRPASPMAPPTVDTADAGAPAAGIAR